MLGKPHPVKEPKKGVACEPCNSPNLYKQNRKKRPADFIGWVYSFEFKKTRGGKFIRCPAKKIFAPYCRVHWMERMHNLFAFCCPDKKCIDDQAKKLELVLKEDDFICYYPLITLIADMDLRCEACGQKMVMVYEAKWTSHYNPKKPAEPRMKGIFKKVKKAPKPDDLDKAISKRGLSKRVESALEKRESSRRARPESFGTRPFSESYHPLRNIFGYTGYDE